MKHVSKFAVIGAVLLGMVGAAAAQSQGTINDRTGNQSTGGGSNQQPEGQMKKTQGGQGG